MRLYAAPAQKKTLHELTPSDEAELARRVREGDPGALETIFHAYYLRLYRFAYRLVRSREVAEEIVQDVFCRVWAQRSQWAIDGAVRPYLFAAVRNGALSVLRRERLAERTQTEVAHSEIPPLGMGGYGNSDPEQQAVTHALHEAIAKLPTRARTAMRWRIERGLTNPEIAQAMGISVKAVEFNMLRAMRMLRETFGR